jgi:hypothetical protein
VKTTVTPEEAKAVWDSMENPSAGKVTDKIIASGKFATRRTINRWKKANWVVGPNPVRNSRPTGLEQAQNKIETAVAVITKDPTVSAEAVVEQAAQVTEQDPGASARAQLVKDIEDASDDALMVMSARKMLRTCTMLAHELEEQRELLVKISPSETGDLIEALAEGIHHAQRTMMAVAEFRAAVAAPVEGEVVSKVNSPIATSIEAWRKQRREAANAA